MLPYERLRIARERRFTTPTEAAVAHGWNPVTYRSHENGTRGIRTDAADRYARAFRVRTSWLLTGEGPMDRSPAARQNDADQELLALWDNLDEHQRQQALRVIQALKD